MNFLEHYFKKIIKHDLVNKFHYKPSDNLPELKKITLNFGCKNFSLQKIATTLLALELITYQRGEFSITKKPNILLKIQKGYPAGCTIVLTKKNIYPFLTKLSTELFPRVKNFLELKVEIENRNFFFTITKNNLVFHEFEEQYPLFNNLPNLDVNFKTNLKKKKELLFIIKAFKLPIKK